MNDDEARLGDRHASEENEDAESDLLALVAGARAMPSAPGDAAPVRARAEAETPQAARTDEPAAADATTVDSHGTDPWSHLMARSWAAGPATTSSQTAHRDMDSGLGARCLPIVGARFVDEWSHLSPGARSRGIGLTFIAPVGTPVHAVATGTIREADGDVAIDAGNGTVFHLGGLDAIDVDDAAPNVAFGELIGSVRDVGTRPFVSLGVAVDGEWVNPYPALVGLPEPRRSPRLGSSSRDGDRTRPDTEHLRAMPTAPVEPRRIDDSAAALVAWDRGSHA